MKFNLKGILFIFSLMLLLSGCTVNYNLTIDKNLKITEEITALEDIKYNDLSYDFLLDRISVKFYDRYDNNYDFLDVLEDDNMGYTLSHQYESFLDFKDNNPIFRDLVKDSVITEYNDIITMKMTISDDMYDRDDGAYTIIPDNMNINIELPFRVTDHNATSKKGNVYTWKIDENNRNIDINMSFDKNKLSNHIYILNIGISYVILLLVGIIITAIISAVIITKKMRGINKI